LIFNWGDRIYSQRKTEKIRQKNQKTKERIKELIYPVALTHGFQTPVKQRTKDSTPME